MRFTPFVALGLCAALVAPAFAQTPTVDDAASDREGPFVASDKTLGTLLQDGFEIKGILGGAMILVRETELFSCGLTPDSETLTYKTYFECSKLVEIPPAE